MGVGFAVGKSVLFFVGAVKKIRRRFRLDLTRNVFLNRSKGK